MAGAYPDVPGFRFEYDRDGSILVHHGSITFTAAEARQANDEAPTSVVLNAGNNLALAWPEVRTVTGMFLSYQYGISQPGDNGAIQTSVDTTNGIDGTWVTKSEVLNLHVDNAGATIPSLCRTDIAPFSYPGIRGIRILPLNDRGGMQLYCFHVYGQWPLTENPNRLVLCDGTGAVVTDGAYLDFGDSARGTIATKPFRIKNNSGSLTANSVTVSFEALYNGTPSNLTQFDFSTDGGTTWVTSKMIGSLGPGSTTPSYTLRRNTAVGAAAGAWQLRLLAVPASMS